MYIKSAYVIIYNANLKLNCVQKQNILSKYYSQSYIISLVSVHASLFAKSKYSICNTVVKYKLCIAEKQTLNTTHI